MNGFYTDIEMSTVKKGHIADIGYLHDRFSMDNRLHVPRRRGKDIHKLKIHFDKLLRQGIDRANVSDVWL
jgi:hypothetical protein